jgi:transaldolase
MIELITTAAMLISSIYGPAQAQASTTPATDASSTSQSSYVASTTDSIKDTMAYVKTAYASDPLLIDIARCESAFRQYDASGNILRGKVNPADIGVMQINEDYHLQKAESMGYDIRTTAGNVAYAKYLYDTQGAAPWTASAACWTKQIAMK